MRYRLLLFISILIILLGMNSVSAIDADSGYALNDIDIDDSIEDSSIGSIDDSMAEKQHIYAEDSLMKESSADLVSKSHSSECELDDLDLGDGLHCELDDLNLDGALSCEKSEDDAIESNH